MCFVDSYQRQLCRWIAQAGQQVYWLHLCLAVMNCISPPPWNNGRTLIFMPADFTVLRLTCSRWVTTYVDKPSAIGQPTRPINSAFHPFGVDKWVASPIRCLPPHLGVAPSGECLQNKRQAWCYLQVKLCNPCLSTLFVSWHGAM